MNKVLILSALRSEFFSLEDNSLPIIYTGVGKINATRVTTDAVLNCKPDLILNLGTAGCLNGELLGKVLGVRKVFERDMLAEPLSPRGIVPFDVQDSTFTSDFGTVSCGTGDSFVTSEDEWLISRGIDLVDMELFAIAKVCDYYRVSWRSIKFVSDLANSDAESDWNNSIKVSTEKISILLESALS